MIRLTLIFVLGFVGVANAQELQLADCWRKAEQNYPRAKDRQEYEQIANLRVGNFATAYLPKIDANAMATYQSDVTHLDLSKMPIPGMNVAAPDKDQYKLSIDLSQLIWDGGQTAASKKMELAGLAADNSQVAVDLYMLKGRVAQLFYGIVLKNQQVKTQETLKVDLLQKLAKTSSGVRNGAVLKSNELLLQSEIIRIGQEIASTTSDRNGMVDALAILVGEQIPYTISLAWEFTPSVGGLRPEYELFTSQKNRIELANELYSAKRMPKVAAFGQLGYGRPSLNMFNSSFDSFYYVGVKASWNIFDWNSTKRDRQVLRFQQNMVDNRQAMFEQQQKMELAQESKSSQKYEALLKSDEELVAARGEVAKAYSVMYDNGAIDAADYVGRVTEQKQAELNREMHRVLLSFSKVNINIINGK
jgi:outer membrane protein TolC